MSIWSLVRRNLHALLFSMAALCGLSAVGVASTPIEVHAEP